MNSWYLVPPDQVYHFYCMPQEIAFNPNYKFYAKRELTMDDFDLFALLLSPEQNTELIFRFWTINEVLLHREWDIFTGRGCGFLFLEPERLRDLIEILLQEAEKLEEISESQNTFEFIPESDYAKYHIEKISATERNYFYIQKIVPISSQEQQANYTVILLSTGTEGKSYSKLFIKTIQLPITTLSPKDYRDAKNLSFGVLQLTKKAAIEFCQILQKHLENFENP